MHLVTDKATRDSYGIDTFERGLAWSLLLLREGYVTSGDTDFNNYFRYSVSTRNVNSVPRGLLNFEGNVDVPETLHSDGVDVLSNILEPITTNIIYEGGTAPSSAHPLVAIANDNNTITTLEQYFYWCAINLLFYNYNYFSNRITIQQNYTNRDNVTTIRVTGNLDIDYPTLLTEGLIPSIGKADYGITPVTPNNPSSGGQLDGEQLNNDNQLNNGGNNSTNSPQLNNNVQLSNNNQLIN